MRLVIKERKRELLLNLFSWCVAAFPSPRVEVKRLGGGNDRVHCLLFALQGVFELSSLKAEHIFRTVRDAFLHEMR